MYVLLQQKENFDMSKDTETKIDELPDGLFPQISDALLDFKKKQKESDKAGSRVREIISNHNKSRNELIMQKWEEDNLGWCTSCGTVVCANDLALVLVSGKQYYEHGYGNSFYGFKPFKHLHNACPSCQESKLAKDGWYGPHDSQAGDQESFFARVVEVDDSEGAEMSFATHPKNIDDYIKEEWKIPPMIVYSNEKFGVTQLHISSEKNPPFVAIWKFW